MQIGLAIILHPAGRAYLIARRPPDSHLGGYWEFPGGKVAEGESFIQCAVREAREEAGLDVDPIDLWPPITHEYPDRTVTLHPVLCRAKTADVYSHASTDVAWVAPSRLSDYAFPEANSEIIARIARGILHDRPYTDECTRPRA